MLFERITAETVENHQKTSACLIHEKFEQHDLTCSILTNLGRLISKIVIFVTLKLIIVVIVYLITKRKKKSQI